MQITHLAHACLLIEDDDTRLLIDPGNFSSGFETLTRLDAILVTHQHPDHLDPERFGAIVGANPDARLLLEPETAGVVEVDAESFAAGTSTEVGGFTISGHGGRHAIIHDRVPQIGNTGMLFRSSDGTTLFHPGDCYDAVPSGVDILALPLSAPWAKVSETLAFVRAVDPRIVIPIHDAVVSEAGRNLYLTHVKNFGAGEVRDLRDATPASFSR